VRGANFFWLKPVSIIQSYTYEAVADLEYEKIIIRKITIVLVSHFRQYIERLGDPVHFVGR